MPPCSASSSAVPSISIAAAPSPTTIGTPRERASMATWLAVLPAVSAMPPPRLQSVSRKRVGAMSSPNRMAPAGSLRRRHPVSAAQHLVADVLQVGRAGPEIIVVGNLVADDLGVEGVDPGIVGRPCLRRSPRRPARSAPRPPAWQAGIRGSPHSPRSRRRSACRCAPSRGDRRAQRLGLLVRVASRQIARPLPGAAGTAAPRRSRPRRRCPSA